MAGARAYFFFDGYPSDDDFASIRTACDPHGVKTISMNSQACRFSWAKWSENRALRRNAGAAPHPKSGSNRKKEYAHILSIALYDVFSRPNDFRQFVQRRTVGWSDGTRELLVISANYVEDVAVGGNLHIFRTIEPDLRKQVCDVLHTWPRIIVGEAGAGKSTLLWSLQRSLNRQVGVQALLLSAAWVLQRDKEQLKRQLIAAMDEFQQAGITPILLLDTVDLLLHDEHNRQELRSLITAIESRGYAALYSTRPQEYALININSARHVVLESYDNRELDRAAHKLARHYCPDSSSDQLAERILNANARWLPVANVCRSPLLLRMLFDLSSPNEPELDDVDVTGLLGAYWERRIVRDARYESAASLQTRPTENLSRFAGYAGIGLLIAGTPDLPSDAFEDSTQACIDSRAQNEDRTVREGLDILVSRGTLVRNNTLVGFFHQIMLEYAAAKGILFTAEPIVLRVIAERVAAGDGDLFVGAALEQTLILAGHNRIFLPVAQEVVSSLISSRSDSIQAIGSVAWVYHNELIEDPRERLREVGSSALQRAARVLPSIANKSNGMTISQLILIWQTTNDSAVKSTVLEAFSRIGMRAPLDVVAAVEYIDPVQVVSSQSDEVGLKRSLLSVLKVISPVARSLVRSSLVALLIRSENNARIELEYLRDQWPEIGDVDFYNEIVRSSTDEQRQNRNFIVGLGSLQAAEWRRAGFWESIESWERQLSYAMHPDDTESNLVVESRLIGIQEFVIEMEGGDERIDPAIGSLLDADSPAIRDLVVAIVLPRIIQSESPSARALESLARTVLKTIGLSAQKGRVTRRQGAILDLLSQFSLPEGLLSRVLPSKLNNADWLSDTRMLRLVPMAADDGVRSAQRLLAKMASDASKFSDQEFDVLFGTMAMHAPKTAAVFDAVLSIALTRSRSSDIEKIVNSADLYPHSLAAVAPALFVYGQTLIATTDTDEKKRGTALLASIMDKVRLDISWDELRGLLDTIDDPEALNPLIGILWKQTQIADVDGQVAYLTRYISVEPEASPPVTRAPGQEGLPISTAVKCTEALLRLLTIRAESSAEHWLIIRTLGLYEFGNDEVFVNGTRFAVVCEYLSLLGGHSPAKSSEFILDYLDRLSTGGFFGITPTLWRRELQNAARLACGYGFGATARSITEVASKLDDDVAEAIIEAVAEQNYREIRSLLQEIASRTSSVQLREYIIDLVRTYDRRLGTRVFPELLEAIK